MNFSTFCARVFCRNLRKHSREAFRARTGARVRIILNVINPYNIRLLANFTYASHAGLYTSNLSRNGETQRRSRNATFHGATIPAPAIIIIALISDIRCTSNNWPVFWRGALINSAFPVFRVARHRSADEGAATRRGIIGAIFSRELISGRAKRTRAIRPTADGASAIRSRQPHIPRGTLRSRYRPLQSYSPGMPARAHAQAAAENGP